MTITAGTRVTTGGQRTGVAVYDSGIASNTTPAVIVIYCDSTYTEETRGSLTTVSGSWIPGTGI